MKSGKREAKRNECPPTSPCWAVFITKAWGQKIEERQWSVALPKEEAKGCITLLRRMDKEYPMGKRYRMRKLPNAALTGDEGVECSDLVVCFDGIHCGVCPHLKPYGADNDLTAKCDLTGNDLMWHDYWIAECDTHNISVQLRLAGWAEEALRDIAEVCEHAGTNAKCRGQVAQIAANYWFCKSNAGHPNGGTMNDRFIKQAEERSTHQTEMEAKHGLTGHPKADKLYALAWDMGHSAGYSEVEIYYDLMADLLKPDNSPGRK